MKSRFFADFGIILLAYVRENKLTWPFTWPKVTKQFAALIPKYQANTQSILALKWKIKYVLMTSCLFKIQRSFNYNIADGRHFNAVNWGLHTDELQNWRAIFGEVLLTFSLFPTPKAMPNHDFHKKFCHKFSIYTPILRIFIKFQELKLRYVK